VSTPQPPGAPEPLPPVEASPPKDDTPSNWQPWLYIRLALVLLAITYVVAFIVQNSDRIKIDFVFANTKVQLIWALLLVLALGILFGVLLSQLYRNRRRAQLGKRAGKKADARPDLAGRDKAEGKPS
jgi:uncharacterized integral membrane protein